MRPYFAAPDTSVLLLKGEQACEVNRRDLRVYHSWPFWCIRFAVPNSGISQELLDFGKPDCIVVRVKLDPDAGNYLFNPDGYHIVLRADDNLYARYAFAENKVVLVEQQVPSSTPYTGGIEVALQFTLRDGNTKPVRLPFDKAWVKDKVMSIE